MLTGLGLRNFKAFGDEMQEAPMSKITLIYGPNSGGKSSVIQALLLLKQSLRDKYSYKEKVLALRGEYTDLGSFQSLMHGHDLDRELGISVKYRNLELGYDVAENDVILTYSSAGKLWKARHKITSPENKEPLLDATAMKQPTKYALGLPSPFSWQGSVKLFDSSGNNAIESNDIVFLSDELLAPSESYPLPALALPGMNTAREQAQKQTWAMPQEGIRPKARFIRANRLRRAEELAQELEDGVDIIGWEWDYVQET